MANQPVLRGTIKALTDDPDAQKALAEYMEAKRPAEQRLAKQRKELDEFFGKNP